MSALSESMVTASAFRLNTGPRPSPVAHRRISSNTFTQVAKRLSLRSVWTTGKDVLFLQRTRKERLEVRDWNTSERSINTDSFCVAQQPDSPLPCEDDDTRVFLDEDTAVFEGRRHNNVLGVDRMLPLVLIPRANL